MKKAISLKLEDELYNSLKKYKEKNKINLSDFLRSIIADRMEYLKRKGKL